MTRLLKYLFSATAGISLMVACNKVDDLPFYAPGTAPVLTSSSTDLSPTAADSTNDVVTFTWTDPAYTGTDSSKVKYVVELDSAGRNFADAETYTVTGNRSLSLTGTQLNNALVAWGMEFNNSYNIDVRVTSSYTNNNELYRSNVVTVKMTPYAIPFSLLATDAGPLTITLQNKESMVETFNWQSPAFPNATFTYELQYDTAGNNFANATTIAAGEDSTASIKGADLNGYAVASGIAEGTQGALDFRVVAIINGRQRLSSSTQTILVTPNVLFATLHVAGDYQGWNPGAAPIIASSDEVGYEGYVNLTTTGGFKFTTQPNWDGPNYGDGGGNKLSSDGGAGNLNVPQTGYYLLKANLGDLTWSATLTTWGVIGSATPKGWDASTPLTFDATTNTWVINSINLTAGDIKFRANDQWDINLGGSSNNLTYGGANIAVAEAGTYQLVLDLSTPLQYKYTLTKL